MPAITVATTHRPTGYNGAHSVEQEKRIRREIANSNERRRMQSINSGFNSLRTMLPKHDGEKLSKVSSTVPPCGYRYLLSPTAIASR